MKNKFIIIIATTVTFYCAQSTRPYEKVSKGTKSNTNEMLPKIASKGSIKFQKFIAADWSVERAGLIDLSDPKAKEADLKEGMEPIQIYYYLIDHPKHGKFLIDSGISKLFKKEKSEWPVSKLVRSAMNLDELKIHKTLNEFLSENKIVPNGIFLTHMHLDHIMGIPDLPSLTPVYVGPNESSHKAFINMFVQGSTDNLFGDNVKIEHLEFKTENPDELQVLDFFGDGSMFILWVSGHTPGSLSFLIQSTNGIELVVGDTSHTVWGWENNVPPGGFTSDGKRNKEKLNQLKEIASKFPKIKVHLGHQSIIPMK